MYVAFLGDLVHEWRLPAIGWNTTEKKLYGGGAAGLTDGDS